MTKVISEGFVLDEKMKWMETRFDLRIKKLDFEMNIVVTLLDIE